MTVGPARCQHHLSTNNGCHLGRGSL
jgi:hypothetical protein